MANKGLTQDQVKTTVEQVAAGMNGNEVYCEVLVPGDPDSILKNLTDGLSQMLYCGPPQKSIRLDHSGEMPDPKYIDIPIICSSSGIALKVSPLPMGEVALSPPYFDGLGGACGIQLEPTPVLERLCRVEPKHILHWARPTVKPVSNLERMTAGKVVFSEGKMLESQTHDLKLADMTLFGQEGMFSETWIEQMVAEKFPTLIMNSSLLGQLISEQDRFHNHKAPLAQLWLGIQDKTGIIIGGELDDNDLPSDKVFLPLDMMFPSVSGVDVQYYPVRPWEDQDIETAELYAQTTKNRQEAYKLICEMKGKAWRYETMSEVTILAFKNDIPDLANWKFVKTSDLNKDLFVGRYVLLIEARFQHECPHLVDTVNAPFEVSESKLKSISALGLWLKITSKNMWPELNPFNSSVNFRIAIGTPDFCARFTTDFCVNDEAQIRPCARELSKDRFSSPRLAVVQVESMHLLKSLVSFDQKPWRVWIFVKISQTVVETTCVKRANHSLKKTDPGYNDQKVKVREKAVSGRLDATWPHCEAWTSFLCSPNLLPNRCTLKRILLDPTDSAGADETKSRSPWPNGIVETVHVDGSLQPSEVKQIAMKWLTGDGADPPAWELAKADYIIRTRQLKNLFTDKYFENRSEEGSFHVLEIIGMVPKCGVTSFMRRLAFELDCLGLTSVLWLKRERFQDFIDSREVARCISELPHRTVVLFCDFGVSLQHQERIRRSYPNKCIHLVYGARVDVTQTSERFSVGPQYQVRDGNMIVLDPFWPDEDLDALRSKCQDLEFPSVSPEDSDQAFLMALKNARRQEAPLFNRHFYLFIFAASHGKFTPLTSLVDQEFSKAKALQKDSKLPIVSWYKLLAFLRATCLESDNVLNVAVPRDVRSWMIGLVQHQHNQPRILELLESKVPGTLRFGHSLFARASLFQMTPHSSSYGPPFPEDILDIWGEVKRFAEEVFGKQLVRQLVRAVFCTGQDDDDVTFRPLTAWCVWKRDPDKFAKALPLDLIEAPHGHVVISRVYRYAAKAIALAPDTGEPEKKREEYVEKSIKFAQEARRVKGMTESTKKMVDNNFGWSLLWAAKFGNKKEKSNRHNQAKQVFQNLGLLDDPIVARELDQRNDTKQPMSTVEPKGQSPPYLSGSEKFKNWMDYWLLY